MVPLSMTCQKSNQHQSCFLTKKKKKKKIRSFFKIILPSTIDDRRIGIPRKFVRSLGKELSDVAELKVPNGRVWYIGLNKTDGEVWFKDGWHEFVEYYSIRAGHFLVFKYDGNSQFYVLIFDTSSNEIDYPSYFDKLDDENHDPCLVPEKNDGEEDLVEIVGVSRCYTPAPVVEIIDEVGDPPKLQRPIRKAGKSNSVKKISEIGSRCNKKRMLNRDVACLVPEKNDGEEDLVEIVDKSRGCTPAPVVEISDEVQAEVGDPQELQRPIRKSGKSKSVKKRSLSTCEIESSKKRMLNHDVACLVPEQNEGEEDLVEIVDKSRGYTPAPVMEIIDEVQTTKGMGNPPELQRPIRKAGQSESVIILSTCETETRCNEESMPDHDEACQVPEHSEGEEDLVDILDALPCKTRARLLEIIDEIQRTKGTEIETKCNKKRMPNQDLRCLEPEQDESVEDSVEILDVFPCQNPSLGAELGDGHQVQKTNTKDNPPFKRRSSRLAGQSSSVKRSLSTSETGTRSNKKSIRNHETEARHDDGHEGQAKKRLHTSPDSQPSNRDPARPKLGQKTHSVCETETKLNSPTRKELKRNKHKHRTTYVVESCNLCGASKKQGGYIFKQDVHATEQGEHTTDPERPPNLSALALLRTSVSSKENYKALLEARAFKSENPFFIINMKKTYVRKSLNIPFQFMNAYLGEEDRDVTLSVSNGRTWPVRSRMYNGIAKIYTGWPVFAKENNLQVGDVCVFELIRKEDAVLHVSIFRVG